MIITYMVFSIYHINQNFTPFYILELSMKMIITLDIQGLQEIKVGLDLILEKRILLALDIKMKYFYYSSVEEDKAGELEMI